MLFDEYIKNNFGDSVVYSKLPESGQKVVYKVTLPGSTVALKFVHVGNGHEISALDLKRATNELQLLQTNSIEGVVNIKNNVRIETIELEGRSYLVYAEDFLNSSDISTLKGDWRKVCALALEVMKTLKNLVDNVDVIHRDIKPNNIMYSNSTNIPVLIDFGIARFLKATSITGRIFMGTPGYASPEQIDNAHTVDFRTDIFSLGITAYEHYFGYNPYYKAVNEGQYTDVLTATKFLRLTFDFSEDVPIGFRSVLRKMTMNKAHQRYNNYNEPIEILTKLLVQS